VTEEARGQCRRSDGSDGCSYHRKRSRNRVGSTRRAQQCEGVRDHSAGYVDDQVAAMGCGRRATFSDDVRREKSERSVTGQP
jgi:hypothetical protein